jgi:hypothetical protein
MLDRARLEQLFTFDLVAGRLFWRSPNKNRAGLAGREAGGPRPNRAGKKYWVIGIDGRKYRRSRVIFFLANGCWPTPCVDHINGNSLDDRPENLRSASITENAWNHKSRARRIALPMGVRLTGSGRFEARLGFKKQMLHLGAFDTPAEAASVYQSKRKELYGVFA